MKTESTVKYILRLTVTLLAICAFVALALAGVNAITKDRIAAVKAEKTQKAIQAVLPQAGNVVEASSFEDETGMVTKVYTASLGDTAAFYGYAVEVVPSGFGGGITMMVGVDENGEVLGVMVPPKEKPSTPILSPSTYGSDLSRSAHAQKSLTSQTVSCR